jgi:hypothetical protein
MIIRPTPLSSSFLRAGLLWLQQAVLFKIVQDIERVACRTQRLPHAGPSQLTFVTCHDAGPTASMPPFFLAEGHHIKVTVRVQKQVEAALILSNK